MSKPPLSPAAQAVLDAVAKAMESEDDLLPYEQDIVAAALRAAADQSTEIEVPFSSLAEWERHQSACMSHWAAAQWGYQKALSDLKAIAAELEGTNG